MSKLVSIVVPIYNVEAYLKRCVDSLLLQTYKNIEIILVDDGGQDNSGAICDEYAKRDERIKVIHKPNGGLSDARNKGIDIANGEYIAFVDSDDYISNDFIEVLYEICEREKCDIAQCKFEKVYGDSFVEERRNGSITLRNNIEQLEFSFGNDDVESIVVWNKLYKTNLFNNLRFPFGKINEDEFTTYKLFYKANKIVTVNLAMYGYFMSENSIMRSGYNLKRLHYIEAVEERLEFFKTLNNKLLIEATEENLNWSLRENYIQVLENFPNEKKILSSLKNKYKESCSRLNNLESTTTKDKIKNNIKKNTLSLYSKLKR